MSNLYTNIKRRREELKMSQTELAKKLGYKDRSTIAKIESGENDLTQSKIIAFAQALNTTPAQLMGWEDNENSIFSLPGVMPIPSGKKIPIIGTIACGTPVLATENIEEYIETSPDDKATFALRCKGDSMSPRLMDGDIVLIHQQPTVENGETAAVLIGEEATLKRVYIRENSITLAPENLNYEPIHFTGEDMNDVIILGKVVGYTRYF